MGKNTSVKYQQATDWVSDKGRQWSNSGQMKSYSPWPYFLSDIFFVFFLFRPPCQCTKRLWNDTKSFSTEPLVRWWSWMSKILSGHPWVSLTHTWDIWHDGTSSFDVVFKIIILREAIFWKAPHLFGHCLISFPERRFPSEAKHRMWCL